MDNEQPLPLGALVAAILFSQAKPVALSDLEEATGASAEELEGVITNLRGLFKEELHGFALQDVCGALQLRTSPRAAEAIRRLTPARTKKLSRAALETLAVVAYKQPVQRAEIEAIRGVDVLPTLRTLLDAKLVRMIGHEESVGQPALYGTTERFLERFGLRDLSELPAVRELEQLLSDPGEAEEHSAETSREAEATDEPEHAADAAQ